MRTGGPASKHPNAARLSCLGHVLFEVRLDLIVRLEPVKSGALVFPFSGCQLSPQKHRGERRTSYTSHPYRARLAGFAGRDAQLTSTPAHHSPRCAEWHRVSTTRRGEHGNAAHVREEIHRVPYSRTAFHVIAAKARRP